LEYRRKRNDLIQVFKILKGIDDMNAEQFFTYASVEKTRGHSLKLFMRQSSTQLRKNSFFIRVINEWNALPEELISMSTVNMFKSGLNCHWSNSPHKFELSC
jgi:hypothetical protein